MLTAQRIREALASAEPVRLDDAPFRHAAVMMLLSLSGAVPEILYTVRSENLPTHKGQIAFPGGKIDPGDASPLEAALRETEEEVGIPPSAIEVVGGLDDVLTLQQFRITPFVGLLHEPVPLTVNQEEIAQVFFAPYPEIASPASWRTEMRTWQGTNFEAPYCGFKNHKIWGVTARMTANFLRHVAGWEPMA